MSTIYYDRLSELTSSGRLKIYLIISPPRANSTVIEHALGNSPDIEHECHEPFLGARHDGFDFEHGYKQIYNALGGDSFYKSESNTSVVVKEMSHWIAKNEEYQRLFRIATEPVIILIRNPLLTVESRLRQVVKGLDMRYSLDLQRYLLDNTAIEHGFSNWESMLHDAFSENTRVSLDFLRIRAGKERLYDTPILTLQNLLLDRMSQSEGYANWRDLIQKKLYLEFDYVFFGKILLANKRRSSFEKIEFQKLEEEVQYLIDERIKFFVVDTTDVRIRPDTLMTLICKHLNLCFTTEIIKWGDKEVDFRTEQNQEFEKLWYDTLFSSSRINPPNEIPPKLCMFPDHIREYLKIHNLPVYSRLTKQKLQTDEGKGDLNSPSFHVIQDEYNKRDMGANTYMENAEPDSSSKILLKMEYIDPVYAVTNDESLLSAEEFKPLKELYSEEIGALSN